MYAFLRLNVCQIDSGPETVGEHQVRRHVENPPSRRLLSQHGLNQASTGHPFGPWETGDRRRGESALKIPEEPFTGAIIGPFSTGADQSGPFNAEHQQEQQHHYCASHSRLAEVNLQCGREKNPSITERSSQKGLF